MTLNLNPLIAAGVMASTAARLPMLADTSFQRFFRL